MLISNTSDSSSEFKEIIYSVDACIATITLNRPLRGNRLTRRMLQEIRRALILSENHADIVGNIITGSGDCFCLGVDRSMAKSGGLSSNLLPIYIFQLSKPVVAAINGPMCGLGFTLAIFCDARFADRNATSRVSFLENERCAEKVTVWMLWQIGGPHIERHQFLRQIDLTSLDLHEMKIINQPSEPGESARDAMLYIHQILAVTPQSVIAQIKHNLYAVLKKELRAVLE